MIDPRHPCNLRTAMVSSDASGETSAGQHGPVEFPPTRWSAVMEAAGAEPDKAQPALRELCAWYRPALVAFFRMKLRDPDRAEDLANGFVEHWLEKNRLRHFHRQGHKKFRSYLVTALGNFLKDYLACQPPPAGPLEDWKAPGCEQDVARGVDGQIALALHRRVLGQVRERYREAGKMRRFELLEEYILRGASASGYGGAAEALGLNANAVRQEVHRLRDDYLAFFRAGVLDMTRLCPEEFEAEMRYLLKLLYRG